MNPQHLRQIALLRDVDTHALDRLAAILEERDFVDRQPIFSEGDPGDCMFLITAGRVRIEKQAQLSGPRKLLTVLESGDYFGEMALLDRKPRSAFAIAEGPVKLVRVPRAAFEELQRADSAAALNVLLSMICTSGHRIRRLSAHLVAYDEIGKAMGSQAALEELLNVVLRQLSGATTADWGLVVLCSEFSDHLQPRNRLNLALTPQQTDRIAQGKGFLRLLLQSSEDHLVADINESEPFSSSERLGFETPSLLSCRIASESRLLGFIILGGNQPGQFELDALNLTRGVACQIGQAVLNARHREEEEARLRHARQFVQF